MQAATLPVPLPGPRKMPAAYDMPGKYLPFEEKPFTDRLQAMEESRLAALHYSTGLSATQSILLDDEEHQSILLHDEDGLAPRQRKFRLGRRGNVKTVPPPPTADAQSKPGWSRKLSIRRRKNAPQQPGVDSPTPTRAERTAPDLAPAPPASPVSLPLPPQIAAGNQYEHEHPAAPMSAPAVDSPRSQVRGYLETLGHPADATEAVILAFTEAEYAPDEWMPELQDMQTGNTLANFLELCSTALPDLHAKATQVQAAWRGFTARQSNPQCRAAVAAVAARTAYSTVVASYCPSPVVAPTPGAFTRRNNEGCEDDSTDCTDMAGWDINGSAVQSSSAKVVRLSFAFVTASEKLDLVLSPSTPGHAARVSREIIEDRRRSSMIAHSVICEAGGTRNHVGMCRDEMIVFASDVVKMATSKLSSSTGPIWVNPTWESGEPERVDEC